MKMIFTNIMENVTFVLEFLGIVAVLVIVAVLAEKMIQNRKQEKTKILTTRKIAMVGMFSAIAGVLMLIEVPMPFAPAFYKIDANVTDVVSFVALCVAPLNLLKGTGVSIAIFVLYKPLSPILKMAQDTTIKKRQIVTEES